jgi:hypothetical protein
MNSYLNKASNVVAKNSRISYGIALLTGLFVLIVAFFTYSWNLASLLESSGMQLLIAISGSAMKLLSGLGIALTYATFCRIIFGIAAKSVKGKLGRVKILRILLLIPIVFIVLYAALKFVNAFTVTPSSGLVDSLISVGGIWSLMILVYVVPIAQRRYKPTFSSDRKEEFRGTLSDLKHSIWRGYKEKLRKDYGVVYAKEFERFEARTEKLRQQLSGLLLFPLCLILMIFPPLATVSFVLWIRTFSLNEQNFSRNESLLLLIVVFSLLLIRTLIFLMLNISTLIVYFDTFYAIGIFVSILIFAAFIVNS